MKKMGIYWILFILFGTIAGLIIFLLINNFVNQQYDIIENESEIHGEVLRVFTNHGDSYIELLTGRKIIVPNTSNRDYTPSSFSSIISKGDSIVKYFESDTIYIIRSNERYGFPVR